MELLLVIAGAWAACGVLAYGLELGSIQHGCPLTAESNWRRDRRFALLMGLLGPIGLVSVSFSNLVVGFPFRLMYRRPTAAWYRDRRARAILAAED